MMSLMSYAESNIIGYSLKREIRRVITFSHVAIQQTVAEDIIKQNRLKFCIALK
jgi:hypothetical protein